MKYLFYNTRTLQEVSYILNIFCHILLDFALNDVCIFSNP